MARSAVLLAVLLVVGACSSDGGDTVPATTTTVAPTTSAAPTTTYTEPVPDTTTTTTTSLPAGTTTSAAGGVAEFAIRLVVFGDLGFVAIQNVGTGTGTTTGLFLCQEADCLELPGVELAPSGQMAVAAGDGAGLDLIGFVVTGASGAIGDLTTDGEMALYRGEEFSIPDALVDYVEWGSTGHARSAEAVAAGFWPEGGFVDVPDESLLIGSISNITDGPEDWTAEFGG